MFLAIGCLLLVAALILLIGAMDLAHSGNRSVRRRLRAEPATTAKREDDPSQKRVVVRNVNIGRLKFVATATGIAKIDRNMQLADIAPDKLPMVLAGKFILPAVAVLPAVVLFQVFPKPLNVVVFAFLLVVAYLAPDIIVRGRAQERQDTIRRDLADILDQITIAIDAGMGFESALARVGSSNKGPLGDEITRTVQDMTLGVPRRDAYEALGARSDIDDLQRFVKSMIQADEFGVPVSQVVRTQAEELRGKRRERAREAAIKVPLKLLFPMMVCQFPVLFLVILTPAIINLSHSLN